MHAHEHITAGHAIPEKVNVPDIVTLTARLAQVLAEEVDSLTAMNLGRVKELQQEKLFLVNALEAHRRQVATYPHLAETIPSHDRRDLEGVVKVFEDILEENHRRLLVAREVNQKIVHAITQVVKENATSAVYGGRGKIGALGADALSITVNHTA
ncbi:MAG: hypothetical protein JO089_06970 [Alphaproteobacteria bacterium]|nr:hypothetical protein [Alphaproteobacteria bacterium]